MPSDRREMCVAKRDSYTTIQRHKRTRYNKTSEEQGKMSDRQCFSLLPSPCDNEKVASPSTPWNGWKVISAESSPCSLKEKEEFPPLTGNKEEEDIWLTPEIKNWADYMDEQEAKGKEDKKPLKQQTPDRKHGFKRKLLLSESGGKPTQPRKSHKPILTDEHRLAQRQKQIDFGKNTTSYDRYLKQRPRYKRQQGDPRTPDKFQICSTRSWTGQIKSWRRRLHDWDLPVEGSVDPFTINTEKSGVLQDIDMNAEKENWNTTLSTFDTNSLKENLPL